MNLTEKALVRGWVQGMPMNILSETYLEDAGRLVAERTIRDLCHRLAIRASLLGLVEDKKIWESERQGSEGWIKKALSSLELLYSKPDPKPKATDLIKDWLPENLVKNLAMPKIKTIDDLANFINTNGKDWWRPIPVFGAKSAGTVHDFYKANEDSLSIRLDLDKNSSTELASANGVVLVEGIAPFERFSPPVDMSGSNGANRGDVNRCALDASNDYQAISMWLSMWDSGSDTYRSYRKEAERFLLWAIYERQKPFSSINTHDCAEYRKFLFNPQPVASWIGNSGQRWSPNWRPFRGPLKDSSVKQAEVILSSLCDWLVSLGYLVRNPFAMLSSISVVKTDTFSDRYFPQDMWDLIVGIASERAKNTKESKAYRARYRRIWFILVFAYRTGLRMQELVNAKVGDIKSRHTSIGKQHWLDVVGKGNKFRKVPLPADLVNIICTNITDRGYGGESIEYIDKDIYIVETSETKKKERNISKRALFGLLKAFFKDVADHVRDQRPDYADHIERASTHWLRHTHGTHATEKGVPVTVVRDMLGHKDISTTSRYLHTDKDRMFIEAQKLGESAEIAV